MPTKNRRIATYLPQEIDVAFKAFKSDRKIEGDSQALINILSEFLGVSQQVTHSLNSAEYATKDELEGLSAKVAHLFEQIQNIDGLVEQAVNRAVGRLQSELSSKRTEATSGQLELLEGKDMNQKAEPSSKLDTEVKISMDGLSARKLEERFKQSNRQGASRKIIAKQKDLPDFAIWSAAYDPEGIAWEYRDNKYYPTQDATSNSLGES